MFHLDPRTVIFVNFAYSLCILLFLSSAIIYQKLEVKRFLNWFFAFLFICLNFLILSLRSIIPVSIVIVLPHILTVWALIEIKRGLTLFYQIKNRIFTDFIILAVVLTLLLINKRNAQLRIATISIASILVYLDTIFLFKGKKKTIIPFLFSISTGIMVIRLIMGLQWKPGSNPMESGNSLSIISILFFVSNIVIFFALFFIVIHKLLIERDELIEKVRSLSLTDELTGLMNRRGFKSVTKYEVNRFARTNIGFTFIIGDIDHFKDVNDEYGHDCGDLILKDISGIILSSLRESDTLARWGGEEFVILLPETTLDEAELVLERIRDKVELYDIIYKEKSIKKTISFGACYCSNPNIEIEDVIKRADESLYKAKNSGRNRVVTSFI